MYKSYIILIYYPLYSLKKKLDFKENQKFLFNIIVPVFNAEKYLEKTLNSIIKQSYNNYQVRVVDDCSTDSSFDVSTGR